MTAVKVHFAGEPRCGKQQCIRCHTVIGLDGHCWRPGALIRSSRNSMSVITEAEAAALPPCGKRTAREALAACPDCGSLKLIADAYDFGTCQQTGYQDAGERFRCLDCGATGDAEDVLDISAGNLTASENLTSRLNSSHDCRQPARIAAQTERGAGRKQETA